MKIPREMGKNGLFRLSFENRWRAPLVMANTQSPERNRPNGNHNGAETMKNIAISKKTQNSLETFDSMLAAYIGDFHAYREASPTERRLRLAFSWYSNSVLRGDFMMANNLVNQVEKFLTDKECPARPRIQEVSLQLYRAMCLINSQMMADAAAT